MVSVMGWILFGLITGASARVLHPDFDRIGWPGTMVLGILGSLVGGGIAFTLRLGSQPYQPGGWIMAVIGAVFLLSIGYLGTRTRTVY